MTKRYFGKASIVKTKRGLSKINPLVHRRKTLTDKTYTNPLKRSIEQGNYPPSKRSLTAN